MGLKLDIVQGREGSKLPVRQVAALCYRGKAKERQILLITSRDTGRWIIPKGWPEDGMDPVETAVQEAWEEAGVIAKKARTKPLGQFTYDKVLDNGASLTVQVDVFAVKVGETRVDFPEASQRRLKWMTPKKAAERLDDPDLAKMIAKI